MKKKLLIGFAALAIAAVGGLNISINSQKNDLSAVSLANVEALAQGEEEKKEKKSPYNLDTGKCHDLNEQSCPKSGW